MKIGKMLLFSLVVMACVVAGLCALIYKILLWICFGEGLFGTNPVTTRLR